MSATPHDPAMAPALPVTAPPAGSDAPPRAGGGGAAATPRPPQRGSTRPADGQVDPATAVDGGVTGATRSARSARGRPVRTGAERRERPRQALEGSIRRPSRTRPQGSAAATDPASVRPTPATAEAPGFDPAESPLVWLARRAGRDGRPMVDATQLTAGERLRADFTRAALTPRVTSRWSEVSGGGSPEGFSDMVLAAKLRVSRALAAVGPELSGVLLDVCCFLKGLETVERERGWPARTAKVVLGLALDRLATHYGLARSAEGRARAPLRAWHAPPGPSSPPVT